jgi:hypothetical protein
MAIFTRDNQYQGVNPHLHSYFQAQGGWSSFHTNFIAALARDLNQQLPDGFVVDIEQSLQIREVHPDTGERIRRPEPDLTIYRTSENISAPGSSAAVATLSQPIPDTLDLTEDLYYSAVVIYRVEENTILGRAVTRIELLSPTNKHGEGYIQYREKRYAALKSGVALVEIDFLHETPPVVKGVPHYPTDSNSHAYNITVSDPTPSFEAGIADTYAFSVDVPIPTIALPLGDGDQFKVELDVVYQDVYASLVAYSRRVDYEQMPLQVERYSVPDQTRIRERMARIRASQQPASDVDVQPPLE